MKESDEQKAQRVLSNALRQIGWTAADLKTRRKGDRKKGQLAAQLRAQTTMTWSWIAERLAMGHWRTALNATRAVVKRL